MPAAFATAPVYPAGDVMSTASGHHRGCHQAVLRPSRLTVVGIAVRRRRTRTTSAAKAGAAMYTCTGGVSSGDLGGFAAMGVASVSQRATYWRVKMPGLIFGFNLEGRRSSVLAWPFEALGYGSSPGLYRARGSLAASVFAVALAQDAATLAQDAATAAPSAGHRPVRLSGKVDSGKSVLPAPGAVPIIGSQE